MWRSLRGTRQVKRTSGVLQDKTTSPMVENWPGLPSWPCWGEKSDLVTVPVTVGIRAQPGLEGHIAIIEELKRRVSRLENFVGAPTSDNAVSLLVQNEQQEEQIAILKYAHRD
ncbi:hypothetical protein TIFTF001_020454 [Ficus carica]|uniref:Uncharacterized protein n=1 Tax=Ficus carica TaxID=3494 RepID=A0AA88AFS3_FICCA|nr:hypothetical protein TIFTF001_020454 [Ficus carica]